MYRSHALYTFITALSAYQLLSWRFRRRQPRAHSVSVQRGATVKRPHLKGEDGCASTNTPGHHRFRDAPALERVAHVVLVSSPDLSEEDQHLQQHKRTLRARWLLSSAYRHPKGERVVLKPQKWVLLLTPPEKNITGLVPGFKRP